MTTKNSEFRNKYGTIWLIVGSIAILFLSIGSLIYANISGNWTEPSTMEKSSDWDKTLTIENWNAVLNDLKYLKENGGSSSSTSWQIEIYWDENTTMIAVCNKWLTDNVPSGKWDWIWVPARYVPTAYLDTLNQQAYRKSVVWADGKNYICKWFAVMKYEASNVSGKPTSDYVNETRVSITQPDAITACSGSWFHLITNNEWMAIARNIEQQGSNWSWDAVWNWFICNWNVTWSDYTITPANNDTTELAKTCTSNASDNRRALKLSNNAVIWDLSWNSWEHVNKANTPQTQTDYASTSIAVSNACWSSAWFSWSWNDGQAECVYQNNYTRANYWPNGVYNANQGMGKIYSYTTSGNIFLRGGCARDGASAGVFTLHLGRDASAAHTGIGFRCSL